jgi:uncharacterized SAM-binding protein YcdF (DUF218 family)
LSKTVRRAGAYGLVVLLAAGILLFATQAIWLRWLGEYLTNSEPPCKADMIVVPAGDYFGNRILKAGELMHQGWAPKTLVSGAGVCYGVNEGDLAIQFAVRSGLPTGEFQNFPSPARSTVEEGRYIVPELRRLGVHRYILVTSDFHTRRAAAIFHKAGPDLPFCTVAASGPDFSPDGWWHSREGRKTAFFEWCKTIANFLGI